MCGVPDVGKSTLINTLMRPKATKTGDDAGITQAEEALAVIARQRGLLQGGCRLHWHNAAEAVLNDFHTGAIGRITLATPQDHAAWTASAMAVDEQRAVARALRKRRIKAI